MAYKFLKLDEIPDYVQDRLDLYKNNKEVSKLGTWVKLTSGAGDKNLGETRAGLTIVSNPNIPTFGIQSIHGTLDREAPIGSKSFDGNPQSYESMEPKGIGYRPRPIVESITITNGTRGLSRKAEFEITCYTREQSDQISKYFLEPGFTVAIEWGWNVADSYQQISRGLKGIADLQNFDILEKRREDSNGTYDAYFGFVTGGGISQSDGTYTVSVQCSGIGEVFSYIQQQNNSDNNEVDGGDKERTGLILNHTTQTYESEKESFIYMFNDLPEKWRTERVRDLINDNTVSDHNNFINFIPSVQEALNERTKRRTWIRRLFTDDGSVEVDGAEVTIPSGMGIVDTERFIRFGVLMKILNSGLQDFEKGVKMNNGKYVRVSIDTNNVPITAFPRMFSLDGSKLYVPNILLPDFGLTRSFASVSEDTTTFSDIARNSYLVDSGIWANFESNHYKEFPRSRRISDILDGEDFKAKPYFWGFLNDLCINFDFAVEVLNRKGLTIRDVLYELLNGMSASVNNMWDFQVVEDVDDNGQMIVSVVDYDFTGLKEKQSKEFVSVGTESSFESFALDIDIPGAMMSQIIGRRLSEKKTDPQDELQPLPNRLFGDGVTFKDYVMGEVKNRIPARDDDTDEDTPGDPPQQPDDDELIKRNFEFFMKNSTVIPTVTSRKSPLISQKESSAPAPRGSGASQFSGVRPDGTTIRDVELEDDQNPLNYVFAGAWDDEKLFNDLKSTDTKSTTETGLSPLLPITTKWSTFGISGIRNGLTYRILDLPEKYRNTGLFQITEVSHTITGLKWTTSVEGKFRQGSV